MINSGEIFEKNESIREKVREEIERRGNESYILDRENSDREIFKKNRAVKERDKAIDYDNVVAKYRFKDFIIFKFKDGTSQQVSRTQAFFSEVKNK